MMKIDYRMTKIENGYRVFCNITGLSFSTHGFYPTDAQIKAGLEMLQMITRR